MSIVDQLWFVCFVSLLFHSLPFAVETRTLTESQNDDDYSLAYSPHTHLNRV